jgi:hypothetical protein
VPEDLVVPAVRAASVVPESPVAPVGLAVRVAQVALVNRVAQVLAIGRAAAVPVLGIDLAEVLVPAIGRAEVREPETVQVEAVPERGPVAVQLKNRSAIAVHHRDRVVARRVEDLAAAVAEITHEPVATEVEKAWAAAE